MTRPECELRRLHEHSLLRSVASPVPTSPSIGRSDYAALHLRVRPLRTPGRQIAASAYNYALLKPLCVRYSEGSISVYVNKLSSAATFRLPPRHRSFLTVSRRSIPLPTRHRPLGALLRKQTSACISGSSGRSAALPSYGRRGRQSSRSSHPIEEC